MHSPATETKTQKDKVLKSTVVYGAEILQDIAKMDSVYVAASRPRIPIPELTKTGAEWAAGLFMKGARQVLVLEVLTASRHTEEGPLKGRMLTNVEVKAVASKLRAAHGQKEKEEAIKGLELPRGVEYTEPQVQLTGCNELSREARVSCTGNFIVVGHDSQANVGPRFMSSLEILTKETTPVVV